MNLTLAAAEAAAVATYPGNQPPVPSALLAVTLTGVLVVLASLVVLVLLSVKERRRHVESAQRSKALLELLRSIAANPRRDQSTPSPLSGRVLARLSEPLIAALGELRTELTPERYALVGRELLAALRPLLSDRLSPQGSRRTTQRAELAKALRILAVIPNEEVLPWLTAALVNSPVEVVCQALVCLGTGARIYGRAAGALADLLRAAERIPAALGVWALQRVLFENPSLIAAMIRDPGPTVRRAAFAAIAEVLQTGRSDRFPPGLDVREAVARGLSDTSAGVRRWSCAALGFVRQDGHNLLAQALKDPVTEVRLAAIRAARELLDPRTALLLASNLTDPEIEVENAARETIALTPGAPLSDWLREASSSTPQLVRRGLRALSCFGRPDVALAVASWLDLGNAERRRMTAATLARVARAAYPNALPSSAVDALLGRFEAESDPGVINALAEAAAVSGDPRVIPALLAGIAKGAAALREHLVESTALFELLQRRTSAQRQAPAVSQ